MKLARDDFFTFSEDTLFFGGFQMLDVLANDRGGRAVKLHSIDDGPRPNCGLNQADPKFSSVDAVTSWETSQLGARIAIVDGKIAYDASTISNLRSLAVGETLVDKFTYAITLPNGKLSYSTVFITIQGSNDWPIIWASSGDSLQASISEDSTAGNGSITAQGTVTVSDADLSDTVSVSVTNAWLTLASGNLMASDILPLLTLSASDLAADPGTTGNLAWTFTGDAAMFDYLEEGQSLNLYYEITVTDTQGASTTSVVTITVTGTSLPAAPVISLAPGDRNSATLNEGAGQAIPLSAFGTLTATDANPFDTLTASITGVELSATTGSLQSSDVLQLLTLANSQLGRFQGNLSWLFNGNSALFDYLLPGQHVELAYTIAVSDGTGGFDTEIVTITVAGSNEAPVVSVSGTDSSFAFINEDGSPALSNNANPAASYSGTLTVSDPDGSGAMTATVLGVSTNGDLPISNQSYLDWFSVSLDNTQATNNLAWTFEMQPEFFDGLAQGQTIGILYTIQISDGQGGIVNQDVLIAINGQNDPVIRVMGPNDVTSVVVQEDQTAASGSFTVFDADIRDFLIAGPASPVVQVEGNIGTLTLADLLTFANVQFPVKTFPQGTSTIGWSFNAPAGAFDYLEEGEQVTITYNLQVSDSASPGIVQPFSITINGSADLII